MIRNFLTTAWLLIYLLLMVFTAIMYGSIFPDLKKSTGNFLSYYIIISLLIGFFFTTRELIKAIKKDK